MGSLDDIQRMKTMEAEYTKMAFPEDSIDATFHGTSIYWKPQSELAPDDKNILYTTQDKAVSSSSSKKNSEEDLVEKMAAAKIT